jgi:hypothetical protein
VEQVIRNIRAVSQENSSKMDEEEGYELPDGSLLTLGPEAQHFGSGLFVQDSAQEAEVFC